MSKDRKKFWEVSRSSFPSTSGFENIYTKSYIGGKNPSHNLVIIHDICDHHGRYEEVINYIDREEKADINIHYIDLKGHGLSSGSRSYVQSFREYSDDLLRFIKIINEQSDLPITLLGHGVGALVILNLMKEKPDEYKEYVSAQVFSNPCIKIKYELPHWSDYLENTVLGPFLAKVRIPFHIKGSELTSDEIKSMEYDSDPLVNHFMANSLLQEIYDVSSNIRQVSYYIDRPTLTLVGLRDFFCDHEMTQLFHKGGDKKLMKLVIYPSMRHDLFNEIERDKFFKTLYNWVKQH